jgi:hypothetical protein
VAIHVALVGNRRRHGAVPVGEALKLRLAQCWQARSWLLRALAVLTWDVNNKTPARAIYLDVYPLSYNIGYAKTSLSILLSLVKTHPSRHSTRQYPLPPTSPHCPLVPGAPYNAIVRFARRHISLRVHSSHCIPSIPRLNPAIRHHVFGVKRRLA